VSGDPLRYFRIEAREISAELLAAALDLHGAGGGAAAARMLRLAHTMKGAAGIVKQQAIAAHAHALEDALAPHRDTSGQLPPDAASAAMGEIDAIAALVAGLAGPRSRMEILGEESGIIHAETADLDGLLHGIGEADRRLNQLRAVLARQPAAVAQQLGAGIDQAGQELRQLRGQAEKLRLLSCRAMLAALELAARNTAEACGKAVEFSSSGGDIRLDARLLVPAQRALVQLVRNAVAHGIEARAVRRAAGKKEAGQVTVEIIRAGAEVRLVCRDDGAGIDLEAVRAAAARSGLELSQSQGTDALFQALLDGFSTAAEVTESSGRGVGLAIVREAVARLGGRLCAASEKGGGARIEIVVPASLAAAPALLVQNGGQTHAIALGSVCRVLRPEAKAMIRAPQGMSFGDGEAMAPMASLSDLLAGKRGAAVPAGAVLLLQGRSGRLALGVDRILGSQDIVVRPLPRDIAANPMVAGLSLDADGAPRLLLDADGLIAAFSRLAAGSPAAEKPPPPPPILVIDDSLTTRALEQSILESAGYEVEQASSAEEGLQKARARRFGVILVDVEMPGMDGFAFLESIRADPGLSDIPAILVTSRDAPHDKARGLAAGASDYVVKGAFNQNRFLATVRRLLEAA
jgi:two-component system chemotaxis sensor kinase CheA